MTKLNPNHLIWAIAVVLTVGVPGSIATWNLTRPTVGPVDPTPAPTPVVAYAELVRTAASKLTGDIRSYQATQYDAIRVLCDMPNQPTDAKAYQDAIEVYRTVRYGDPYPYAEELKELQTITAAEAERRGLLEGAWDKAGWRQFADDTLKGLLP